MQCLVAKGRHVPLQFLWLQGEFWKSDFNSRNSNKSGGRGERVVGQKKSQEAQMNVSQYNCQSIKLLADENSKVGPLWGSTPTHAKKPHYAALCCTPPITLPVLLFLVIAVVDHGLPIK